MIILQKAYTTDDFSIQLENWEEDYPGCNFDRIIIAAYPKGKWRCCFRGEYGLKTVEEAERIFECLLEGTANVLEFDFTVMIPGGRRVPMIDKIKESMIIV